MRTKKVNRYYCDFCKKANCSGPSIALHERHCTLNPNRSCRMCKKPRDISALLSLVPSAEPFHKLEMNQGDGFGSYYCDHYADWGDAFKEPERLVRQACEKCPACVLAVLRQSKVPLYIFDFDFKNELKTWWADKNEEAARDAEYATY